MICLSEKQMVLQPHTNYYLDFMKELLVEEYNLTEENAKEAVEQSSVKKMLYDEEEARWQMHQSFEATAEDIYREFRGLPPITW